jgi:hypothetical protein
MGLAAHRFWCDRPSPYTIRKGGGPPMKVKLKIHKGTTILQQSTYDISDAESFGKACADLWIRLRDDKLTHATSIGALYDQLNEQLLDELFGAQISIARP